MKKIKEGEQFQLGNRICSYVIESGKIKISFDGTVKPKNKFIPPTIEEVKRFFKSKSYKEESAISFYEYYDTLAIRNENNEVIGWQDKNNEPVKNWKAKAMSVWFRPEHKIVEFKLETTKTPGFKFFQ